MPKTNRAPAPTDPATSRHRDHSVPDTASWQRLVFTGLLAGAARRLGSLLVGLAVLWWDHD
ncbi:hypothetical protein [Streptomyces sp. NBC_00687]|uniref:hypothetical protein n=1 Tax=Streptomyces sp. NBC_00687 TaxID=2975807 RepID=UPI00224FFD57|nr:hypothetical protein [Streptomyces sp. NBC_00687]MCX4920097.1 hypothetical protein [Streptomyces sp. NBC_00687]